MNRPRFCQSKEDEYAVVVFHHFSTSLRVFDQQWQQRVALETLP